MVLRSHGKEESRYSMARVKRDEKTEKEGGEDSE
jgi:hypothetical protein